VIAPELQFSINPDPARVPASVMDFMKKVTVQADEALLVHFPKSWPAKVSVTTAKGTREKPMLHVPGDPERPFDAAQIADKFRRVVAPVAGAERAGALHSSALEVLDARGGAGRVVAALAAR
jgi:2-methylcitrate dehydratase PrpD